MPSRSQEIDTCLVTYSEKCAAVGLGSVANRYYTSEKEMQTKRFAQQQKVIARVKQGPTQSHDHQVRLRGGELECAATEFRKERSGTKCE